MNVNQIFRILLIFLLVLYMHSGKCDEDIKDYDIYQVLDMFTDLVQYRPGDSYPEDVSFYLFTRNVSNVRIRHDDKSTLNPMKSTKFVIHGYLDNHNRSWYHNLTKEYLKKGDFNVIQVDWWRVARSFYYSAAQNIKTVGEQIGKFIYNHNLNPKMVHIIGHSLGAHTAGFAGQTVQNLTGTKIARITGLDPAGPGFRSVFVQANEKLDENDADVVDVIHTDGGMLGYYRPLGTFDIYVNGGTSFQPNCFDNLRKFSSAGEFFENTYCSHTRSYVYFTEIVNNHKFSCRECQSWLYYMSGFCSTNRKIVFGAEDINRGMTGVCFVNTTELI